MPTTLGACNIGDEGRIVGYDKGAKTYRKRLMSMGLTPHTLFRVVRRAPLGDPMEINVRGYSLSLRRDEASAIIVDIPVVDPLDKADLVYG